MRRGEWRSPSARVMQLGGVDVQVQTTDDGIMLRHAGPWDSRSR